MSEQTTSIKSLFREELPSGVRVTYENFSEPLLQIMSNDIREIGWMFPKWLKKVYIDWRPESEAGDTITITVNTTYRQAALMIRGAYFDAGHTPEVRREDLIHEVMHLYVNGFADWVREEIKRLLPDAPMYRSSLGDALTDRLEQAVVDLTGLFSQKTKKELKELDIDGMALEIASRIDRQRGASQNDPGGIWRATIAKTLREFRERNSEQ